MINLLPSTLATQTFFSLLLYKLLNIMAPTPFTTRPAFCLHQSICLLGTLVYTHKIGDKILVLVDHKEIMF